MGQLKNGANKPLINLHIWMDYEVGGMIVIRGKRKETLKVFRLDGGLTEEAMILLTYLLAYGQSPPLQRIKLFGSLLQVLNVYKDGEGGDRTSAMPVRD
jgi:hypothetical protein